MNPESHGLSMGDVIGVVIGGFSLEKENPGNQIDFRD